MRFRLRSLVAGAALFGLTGGTAVAQDATVTMPSYRFAPAELHVAPGTTVTFTNDSDLAHTVTADDGSFDSGSMDPGAVWTMEFDDPGTYPYFCIPHGSPGGVGMAAVIVVDDPGT